MLGDLSGKSALVTGAGSKGGLGASIAGMLARHGADVAVTDLDLDGARQVASGIDGVETLALGLDVVEPESVRATFAKVLSEWGRLDILVNNAGIGGDENAATADEVTRIWDKTYAVNVRGLVLCCGAALPSMRKRRYGKIVNIASIAGHAARGHSGAYGASKAAVLRYTKGLAVEVGADNVNVNAVCPGAVWTPLQQPYFEKVGAADGQDGYQAFVDYYAPLTPLRRVQSAEDVAKAVVFLASDDAANITGQCLHVDGGAIRD